MSNLDNDTIYQFFADYIYKHSGIFYSKTDLYRLESRLRLLVEHFEVADENEIYQMYTQKVTPEMHSVLINISTNNETYFFRDAKPFKALTKGIIPDMDEKSGTPLRLNIWSTGCSTGQELYSILMSIKEGCSDEIFKNTNIFATDIDTSVIEYAKKGEYDGLQIQRGLPVTLLMKYFEQNSDEKWDISSDLKSKVQFDEFNLLEGIYPREKYDIIFCRNVLIYQQKENKRKILEGIYKALKPNGLFLMGAGESMIGLNVGFKQVKILDSMFFIKEDHHSDK